MCNRFYLEQSIKNRVKGAINRSCLTCKLHNKEIGKWFVEDLGEAKENSV